MMLVKSIIHRVERIAKEAIYGSIGAYKIYYRKKDWRNFALKYTTNYVLTGEQKNKIKQYFMPYTKVNTLFHEFYTEKNGKFCKEYIPDDIYYCYIDPYFNDWEEAKYIDNKCLYTYLFSGIKQPEEFAVRMNNMWFDSSRQQITVKQLREMIENEKELFIKQATESDGGQGVFYYSQGKDFGAIIEKIKGDIIIQKAMKQHSALNNLNSSSVNTIRVISLLSQQGVKIYSYILRMGVNGAKVDNASSGGITCGITSEGRMKEVAYSKGGERFFKHPDSEVKFLDYQIPGFSKILDYVPTLHCKIPHFRLVSWDFAVDEYENPILIEANLHYGELDFHQLNNGPIFGEDTEKILSEVFNKRKG